MLSDSLLTAITRIFMTSPPRSIWRNPSSSPPSGSTVVISRSSGRLPAAASAMALRNPPPRKRGRRSVSARARRSGTGPPWAVRRRSPPPRCGPRVRGSLVIISAPAAEPDTSKTTSAPAPPVRSLTNATRSVSCGFTAVDAQGPARQLDAEWFTSASTTRAPRAWPPARPGCRWARRRSPRA